MKTYVIDASVAVKWLINDNYRFDAKRYLDSSIERLAPDLILLECTNAIRRKVILKQITQQEGDKAFALLQEWQHELFILYPSNHFLKEAYNLSKELFQHPVPDCLYLVIAHEKNCLLVTADHRFYSKVINSRYAEHIAWVEEPVR